MNDGTVERNEDGVTFRYERHLRQSVQDVWPAITDPDRIEQWTGNRPEIDLRVGGHYITYHRDGADRVVDRILQLEPPRLFVHTFWEHINPHASVSWALADEGTGTLLTLTHVMSDSDLRAAASGVAAGDDLMTILSRNAAGWHRLLDLVASHLGGQSAGEPDPGLRQRYAELVAKAGRRAGRS